LVDGSSLNSAELFNWETGVQCLIEPLPQVNLVKLNPKVQFILLKYLKEMYGHSGTLIDGDPIVCGGNDVKHFQYERGNKNWKRVNLLYNFDCV